MVDIALLGCGGMMPLPGRFLTSMLCRLNGRFVLIDCGEGTQVTLKSLGWGFKNIDAILFTHFHADHIAGLPGLLLTIGNSGRTEALTLVGPKGLEAIVSCITVIAREIPFELNFIELDGAAQLDISGFSIKSLPVEHRTTCYAYTLEVGRPGKFNVEKAMTLNIPKYLWSNLQRGEDVEFDGNIYTPDKVMGARRKGIKIAYCTDSRPVAALPDFVHGADLFICEGIYGDNEKQDKAKAYKHMTFFEAANIAKAGNVKEMWLTHYSPSLTNPEDFLTNASDIFPNTCLGFDRKTSTIRFEDDPGKL